MSTPSVRRGARVAGSRTGPSLPPGPPPRDTPYPARGDRGRGGLGMPSGFAKGGPGRLTPDEVEKLMALDTELAVADQAVQGLEELRRQAKTKHRNELDACKQELRGGPLNAEEMAQAEGFSQRHVEAIKVDLLGQIADDRHRLAEEEDDDEVRVREEAVRDAVLAARQRHAESIAALNAARSDREAADAELQSIVDSIRSLEEQEAGLNASTNEAAARKAAMIRERDAALGALANAKAAASRVIASQVEMDGEVRSATQQRSQMEARVNRLSNVVKPYYHACSAVEGVSVVPPSPSMRTTELSVALPAAKAPLTFSFAAVLPGPEGVRAVANPPSASALPVPPCSLAVFVPAAVTLGPVGQVCASLAAQVYEGCAARMLAASPDGEEAVPAAELRAAEVYGDAVRDVLRDDAAAGLFSPSGVAAGEGVAGFFAEVSCCAVADAAGVASAMQRAAAVLQTREAQAPLDGPQHLVVSMGFPSRGVAVTLMFTSGVSAKPADGPAHVLHHVAKLASDPKEAKSQMRRSCIGRLVAAHLSDACPVSVTAIPVAESTAQSVVDACRVLHRVAQVDVGVKAAA